MKSFSNEVPLLHGVVDSLPDAQLLEDESVLVEQFGLPSRGAPSIPVELGGLCKDSLEVFHGLKAPFTPLRSGNPNVTVRKKPGGRRQKDLAHSLGGDDFSFAPTTSLGQADLSAKQVSVSDIFEPLRVV